MQFLGGRLAPSVRNSRTSVNYGFVQAALREPNRSRAAFRACAPAPPQRPHPSPSRSFLTLAPHRTPKRNHLPGVGETSSPRKPSPHHRRQPGVTNDHHAENTACNTLKPGTLRDLRHGAVRAVHAVLRSGIADKLSPLNDFRHAAPRRKPRPPPTSPFFLHSLLVIPMVHTDQGGSAQNRPAHAAGRACPEDAPSWSSQAVMQ